ncbi:hypothetical protein DN826_21410 [Stutzerimonas nosocomialis]|uniref:hypothetical protein n=1 Tax=Stutzerimonas nosocomialis TaxID=1056496 RepID=UPI0011087C15|nr:hypothetical protein [Stutzerimonas nosocomialis]TLX52870.1 hypothetical protein DN826_21410 [Stutzerimonas nosocomialis]
MTESELFKHYERIYFYELSRKEQIFSRLNIPLVVMVAVAGFYAVILKGDYKLLGLGTQIWFWLCYGFSLLALLVGVGFFIDSLLGRMDKAIATPTDTETWRRSLLDYYADEADGDSRTAESVRSMLYEAYMDCATRSMLNNDRKSSSLYYCNVALIVAVAFAMAAYAIETIPTL